MYVLDLLVFLKNHQLIYEEVIALHLDIFNITIYLFFNNFTK